MAFDATKPASSEAKSLFPAQAQANWAAIQAWLDAIGNFPTTPATFDAGVLGLTLIQTQDASADASIDFTSGLSTTYHQYLFVLSNVVPATDNVDLMLRISQSAVFQSGATDYQWQRWQAAVGTATISAQADATADAMYLADAQSNNGGFGWTGRIWFSQPAAALGHTFMWDATWRVASTGELAGVRGFAYHATNTTAIDGARFLMSSGNITSGTFALYGVKKS